MVSQFMKSQSGFIGYKAHKVHCIKMGHGPELLIAFHGFDNDAGIFAPLAEQLQEQYTIVAVDLPGHGQTDWSDRYLKIDALMAIVQGIRNEFKTERFSLVGFSLGGRICLNIAQYQPNWINAMYLIAPDGLNKNIWYQLATRNPLGKMLFKRVLDQPEQWIDRLAWLKKYRLVDESRFKFARKMLTDRNVNHKVAEVWPLMSRLIPDIGKVKWNINKYGIPTLLIMGKYDRIIPPASGEQFIKNIKDNAHLYYVESGHALLHKASAAELARIINPDPVS